ncbi:MAG: hypothetical protein FWG57_00390 [Endomicrobia bacterium]|nr:hypothetical protein [Endomicrobiia bacterium]
MKNIIKFASIILLITFVFPLKVFSADNVGERNVYAVYSENFNGIKIFGNAETPAPESFDNAKVFPWYGPSFNDTNYIIDDDQIEGRVHWTLNATSWALWYGGAVTYVNGASAARTVDMSDYAGGTIEFYVKANTSSMFNLKVGFQVRKVGVDGNRMVGLTSFCSPSDVGAWKKVVINIDSLVTAADDLENVLAPFLYVSSNGAGDGPPYAFANGGIIKIDSIVWKKASGGSFNADLKNISDDTDATDITWDESALGQRWVASKQYLELDLDNMPDDSWGIQIYTANTDDSASPKYTGTLSTEMASGLVASSDTEKMLPMCWRITDKVLPYSGTNTGDDYDKTLEIGFNAGGIFDQGSFAAGDSGADEYYCWFAMKDSRMFDLGDPDIANGADYLRVWDAKGFHAAGGYDAYGKLNYWGMSARSMHDNMIKPRIYFGADFGQAMTPMTYQTNSIVIELFHE